MLITSEHVRQGIALVRLNRPESRNAVSGALARELEAVTRRVERDAQVQVAIITGAGSVFCAGADLREVADGRLQDSFTADGGFAGFVNAPREKIWIAAVNGPALAGGCEIVLACDLVVSLRSAVFGLPEVRRGLIASAGGLYRLPRALPKAVALELILTGGTLSAERAHHFGMINRLCDEDVVGAAIAFAETISANAPLALVESCRIAREATGFDSKRLREQGDEAQDRLSRTRDYHEGSRAFVEKRAPKWSGA